jgi:hypothetical protein
VYLSISRGRKVRILLHFDYWFMVPLLSNTYMGIWRPAYFKAVGPSRVEHVSFWRSVARAPLDGQQLVEILNSSCSENRQRRNNLSSLSMLEIWNGRCL